MTRRLIIFPLTLIAVFALGGTAWAGGLFLLASRRRARA